MRYFISALAFLLLFISSANAIELRFPVACILLGNCWITNHVDLDPSGHSSEDYMCGSKLTNNNRSTHISLASLSAGRQNVPVVAAADGTVKVARDVGGFCGHRVLIDHDQGWETSYCHLQPESLQIRSGQKVQSGDILGLVGMSGVAEWPRLSFAVLRNGLIFDPFSGRSNLEGCTAESEPLWASGVNPPYEPASITDAGFTVGALSNQEILSGSALKATQIRTDTPQLSLWMMMMNTRTGDDVRIEVIQPDGKILNETTFRVEEDNIYLPLFFSTSRDGFLWKPGQYEGRVFLTRRVGKNEVTTGKIVQLELIRP